MNNSTKEALDVLQEECAEVIQAVCKINRFGFNQPKYNSTITNRDHLEQEIGDLYAMIEILQEMDVISWTRVEAAAEAKKEKLKIWSNFYKDMAVKA